MRQTNNYPSSHPISQPSSNQPETDSCPASQPIKNPLVKRKGDRNLPIQQTKREEHVSSHSESTHLARQDDRQIRPLPSSQTDSSRNLILPLPHLPIIPAAEPATHCPSLSLFPLKLPSTSIQIHSLISLTRESRPFNTRHVTNQREQRVSS